MMKHIVLWSILIGSFVACQRANKIVVNDDNGHVQEVYFLSKDSLKEGLATTYFVETGKVYSETPYVNGHEHGVRKIFFPSGKIEETSTYVNGEFHGPSKNYFENGQLRSEVVYVHNSLEGIWISYYEDGAKKEEVTFHDNEENGSFVEYYPNGQLKAKGQYLNGPEETGLLELFDKKGVLIKKMNCIKGRCQTIWTKKN